MEKGTTTRLFLSMLSHNNNNKKKKDPKKKNRRRGKCMRKQPKQNETEKTRKQQQFDLTSKVFTCFVVERDY
jgi:hypothetical protein